MKKVVPIIFVIAGVALFIVGRFVNQWNTWFYIAGACLLVGCLIELLAGDK